MRYKDPEKKKKIINFIDQYYNEYRESPTLRTIANGTGISSAMVHRYLEDMHSNGEVSYDGRNGIITERMQIEKNSIAMPVLGYVKCGEGEEEHQEIIEYIRMPDSIVGKGNFFALIAKGESMVDAGIYPGDYVVVKNQQTAETGDIVVALYEGVSNLKVLIKDYKNKKFILRSCNQDKDNYPDIILDKVNIQGIAVSVTHKLERISM